MISKIKLPFAIFLMVLISGALTQQVKAQNGGINGWLKKQTDKVNKKVDQVFNGSAKSSGSANNNGTKDNVVKEGDTAGQDNEQPAGRPKLSEINDADFVQNTATPKQPGYTRIPIAQNLFIDIKGIYPEPYAPKWRFISYPSDLIMDEESWYYPRSTVQKATYPLSITSYNGKAVLRVRPFMSTEAFADIVIKDSFVVISGNPQTFQITNFRRILNDRSTNEPIKGMGSMPANKGGFEGKLTLSANENGDITMSYMVENYSIDQFRTKRVFDKVAKTQTEVTENVRPSQVSWRYIAKNISIENEMSAEKAIAIIEAEKKAKQARKDYEVKSKKQADSVLKVIAKKYPEAQCKECFYSSRGGYISSSTQHFVYANGDPAPSETNLDYNTVISIKNKCKYDLLFVGIQQFYDDVQGYYLKEVTMTMPVGYDYRSDQGLLASVFTSLTGGGSAFNINVQDVYNVKYATVGAVQWLKVIKSK